MNNNIKWFENAQALVKPYIRFNASANISFNSTAQKLLPHSVDFGYDASQNRLFLREGQFSKSISVKKPYSSCPDLTISMRKSGVIFPINYCIENIDSSREYWEAVPEYLNEAILINKLLKQLKFNPKSASKSVEMQQLLELYDAKIQKCCRSFSRSIPKSDRYQLAVEGFIRGFLTYNPNLHDFSEYIISETSKFLKAHISDYSGAYRELYPLQHSSENGTEYDIYSSQTSEKDYQNTITNCDLSEIFTDDEKKVYQLQTQGYIRKEICQLLHLNACSYNKINASLKRKLNNYYQ